MSRERSPEARQADDRDKTVLELVLDSRFPWSMKDLGHLLDDPIGAEDAAARLKSVGLVHRNGPLLFPTRAAIRAADLDLGVAGENDD